MRSVVVSAMVRDTIALLAQGYLSGNACESSDAGVWAFFAATANVEVVFDSVCMADSRGALAVELCSVVM